MDPRKVRQARVEAAEKVVIDSIPGDLLKRMERADAKFAAQGGCPGCGSKQIAVHLMPCSELTKHPLD